VRQVCGNAIIEHLIIFIKKFENETAHSFLVKLILGPDMSVLFVLRYPKHFDAIAKHLTPSEVLLVHRLLMHLIASGGPTQDKTRLALLPPLIQRLKEPPEIPDDVRREFRVDPTSLCQFFEEGIEKTRLLLNYIFLIMSFNPHIAEELLPEVMSSLMGKATLALTLLGSWIVIHSDKDAGKLFEIFGSFMQMSRPPKNTDPEELFKFYSLNLADEWLTEFGVAAFEIAKCAGPVEKEFFERALANVPEGSVGDVIQKTCAQLQKVEPRNVQKFLVPAQKVCFLLKVWPERKVEIVRSIPREVVASLPKGVQWDDIVKSLTDAK
jgi:hypothetical protein